MSKKLIVEYIYRLYSGANISILLKVSQWLAVECEKVAPFGRGHDIHNLITTYSIMSVCNLLYVTQWRSLAKIFHTSKYCIEIFLKVPS